MNDESVDPNGVHIAGNFADPDDDDIDDNPGLLDWDAAAYEMIDEFSNGNYSITLMLAPGIYEYKFINGNDLGNAEIVPDLCQEEGGASDSRQIEVFDNTTTMEVFGQCGPLGLQGIRFKVDASYINIFPEGLQVESSSASWPYNQQNILHDLNGDNVWEGIAFFDEDALELSGDIFTYRYMNGYQPEYSGSDCFVNGFREVELTSDEIILPAFCFQACAACEESVSALFSIDMVNQPVTEAGVFLNIAIGGEAMLLAMEDGDEDMVYTLELQLQPGTYDYWFINGELDYVDAFNMQEHTWSIEECPRTVNIEYDPVVLEHCWNSCTTGCDAIATADITFNVDVNGVGFEAVDVAIYANFVPFSIDGMPTVMTDPDDDGIFSVTLEVTGHDDIYFSFVAGNGDGNGTVETIEECATMYFITPLRTYHRTGSDETLFFLFNSCNEYTGPSDYGFVDGNVFVDLNQDGMFNGTDFPASNLSVLYDDVNLGDITNDDGNYIFDTSVDDHEFALQLPETFFSTTGNEIQNASVAPGNNTHLDSIGIYSDILTPQFETYLHAVITCSEPGFYFAGFYNTGVLPIDAIVELTLDPAVTFDYSAELEIDSIIGYTYYMTWEDLQPFEYNEFDFNVIWPNFELMGVPLTGTLNICSIDGVTCHSIDWESPVLCAYDPNDKTVTPAGWGEEGFILADTELEYLVRFQNTGNAPATNVRIEDVLDEDLDWTTLNIIGSSHDLTEFEIDEEGRAKFFFDNIMLPDSTSDEVGSHGYVVFRIQPDEGIAQQTVIENTSEIYFDFNPAVITNTVHNTIFDCEMMEHGFLLETSICEDEVIQLNMEADYTEEYAWYADDILISNSPDFTYIPPYDGLITVEWFAMNPLCTVSETMLLTVHPMPDMPVITEDNGLLTATPGGVYYIWYLDGQMISQGISNTYEAIESGNYMVYISNAEGCDTASEQVNVVIDNVNEKEKGQLSIAPNPILTHCLVTIPEHFGGTISYILTNALQQKVREVNVSGKQFVLERGDLPAGVYYLQVHNDEGVRLTPKKIVIR